MTHPCSECGGTIVNVDVLDRCTLAHESVEEPVYIHDDCPCPEHGWDAEREYVRREEERE